MKNKTLTLSYKTDIANVNGHIYPRETVQKAFKEYSEKIENGTAIGTLGQLTPFLPHIDVQQASHKITDIKENEEEFVITAEVLQTPKGKVLQDLIDKKTHLSFGIRSIGTIDENKVANIKEFISIDVLENTSIDVFL